MDAPPPIVSCRLFAAPDVLEDILFEACHAHDESIPKPPFNLPSIALTCRTTSSIVSPKFNPRFYARLFRATFDLPVQLSPCFPCDPSLLTEELPQLWQSLNRLRKSSLQASSSEVLEEDMLIACAMLLQHPTGQTKNRRALLDYAHVDAVSLQLILSRTDKPEYMEHCRRTPIILCALWLLWITSSHGASVFLTTHLVN
ncbi:hypothetical protein SISSUDRAFT_712602 [Sistotremastrum suecicum HHB10207 ss-3]|uniref:Uncharacterized protein n=1 Tax=Sistotremastrum suecicum HHB10207 ss-3 TaxID=1314776 RepID=A0A166DSK6_9AGAM|nr:hypothetical protein SISSUDRAFT_712602 [Sistotremastrum suecicum HHB10207 ss-3]